MVESRSWGSKIFDLATHLFLVLLAAACLVPMIHILAVSLSDRAAAQGGFVGLWPVSFTTTSYRKVVVAKAFLDAFSVSVRRTFIGTILQMLLTILGGYTLSKSDRQWRGRTVLMWMMLFAMLFHGGLIPTFLVIRRLGLLDSLWALVVPNALPIWNVILMMNFFRDVPHEIEEAAIIDGASHFQMLWRIFLPLAKPALATLTLFSAVGHWNAWFDGMVYIMNANKVPLQTYLRRVAVVQDLSTIVTSSDELMQYSERSIRAAQIFVTVVPILVLYPFLQRYFVAGIRLGAIKG